MRIVIVARLLVHILVAIFKLAVMAPRWSDAQRVQEITSWSRSVFALLGVRLVVRGVPERRAGTLYAGNHVSWLDIYALLATTDLRFVAKTEVRDWPLIGWLASRLGTLFITRDRRGEAYSTAFAMAGLLRAGHKICMFPEGTTTDGHTLRPFRAALFDSAAEGRAVVQPFAIRYLGEDGRLTAAAAFVGDTSIATSLRTLLGHRNVTCELVLLPPIATAGMGRRALALAVEEAVRSYLDVGVELANRPARTIRETTLEPGLASF
jgi:1-acyl-sn-glycerol-3-phosphate acyltransferase